MKNEIVIEPKRGWVPVKFRELFYFLAWRDVKVKYKQTALGVIWAILQPFLTMVVFSILFGRLADVPSEGVPYPIFVYIGLLPWQYFASVLGQSTNSVVSGGEMVSKIYFPRLIMPVSTAIAAIIDFGIAAVILGLMMIYYDMSVSTTIVLVPFLVLLTMMNEV